MRPYLNHSRSLFLALGLLLFSSSSLAEQGVLTLRSDNDMYASGDDRHYTSGTELHWSFIPEARHWTRRLGARLPDGLFGEVDGASYRLSHHIYTPEDINTSRLVEGDRPYAGVTLVGFSLHENRQRGHWRQTSDLHVDVGMVGQASGAQSIQREVHRFLEADMPRGWNNQLRNEPLLNAAYRRQWWRGHSLGSLEFEHGPSLTAAVGNLFTYAGAGYGMRLGEGLTRSAGMPVTGPLQSGRHHYSADDPFSWFVFASVEGRYVAQNLLLDGNTFRNGHSVERHDGVGDATLGLALTGQRWQFSFAATWRSEEFHGQNGHDTFGSITLSRHF